MTAARLPQLVWASAGLGAVSLVVAVVAAPAAAEQVGGRGQPEAPALGPTDGATVPERFGDDAGPAEAVGLTARGPLELEPDGLLGMRAGHLVNRDVYSAFGAPIARVDDVVALGERVHLVLSLGGFLGMMTNEVALPIEEFELRIDEVVLIRPISREQLEALPAYQPGAGQAVPRERTIAEVMAVLQQPAATVPHSLRDDGAASQDLLSAAPPPGGSPRGQQPEQPVDRAER